ncbi:MAG: N-acetylmuramoyl-L-alanine amidase [Acidaminococcus intestini]|uniref:Transcriptional regulator n=1 Tax=Acidaminococcus intestini (strain RyC-MR95) TaxID=568816 RepID=G4Q526_ACIIR|nr:transcriptional regulator [Acidaminococcus intestini RyC-MR95]EEH91241.1 N-acetylmuramoyl-L-alanine amidase [Acidaminococcus intestini]MBS6985005.1 N-acetylmuramoyl-L-alanine amidase [Acidaminococcus intestini]RJU38211.1 N-acetylmuramoyl-L-alanine amidase [Acidaminococcus sp. AM33-14BH]
MVKSTGIKGGPIVLKKILLMSCALLALVGATVVHAAPRITKVAYGVSPDRQLRVVLETTTPARMRSEFIEKELQVTVGARLNSSVSRSYVPKNAPYVSKVVLEPKGSETLVRIHMKRKLDKGDYKTFNLKRDSVNKRPTRSVIDVIAGPSRKTFDTKKKSSSLEKKPWRPSTQGSGYSVVGGIEGKRITLDPGHGGTDPGTHGLVTGVYEKNITLPISKMVKAYLEDKGAIVYMTRTTDVDVYGPDATDVQELQARVDVAEENKSDLFISLHINASVNTSVGGYSTYYHPKTKYDIQVAQCIQDELLKTGDLEDLGVRYANFYVNKRSTMPGALVEMLFLTNKREEKLLNNSWFQKKIAKAIADGIEDFYNQHRGG